ncbi:Asd/ArgC dimerization domain-containing protein [uncultured Endozoicomonas sp.]|uniref:Asd/ArgC dimerization domain-containing protein n=1 Tax=uncultured Endozoicomonas sp. TaxID=432652 RepID=UPI0026110EE9|nr:Asd/ArgC dimerization domain-containing protein [uncultured Endozoicomonas sp.]
MNQTLNIAISAADTLAGETLVRQLEEHLMDGQSLPVLNLYLISEKADAVCELEFHGEELEYTSADAVDFSMVNFLMIPSGTQRNVELMSRAVESGCYIVDASRGAAAQGYTLPVMPGFNEHFLSEVAENRYAVMPSSIAAPLLPLIQMIHQYCSVSRISLAVMQSVASHGRIGVDALRKQTIELLNGKPIESEQFDHRLAYNLVPEKASEDENDNESLIGHELRMALGEEVDIRVSATTVPVFFGDSFLVDIDGVQPFELEELKAALEEWGGVSLLADEELPTVERIAGSDEMCIGRIQQVGTYNRGLSFWVVADSLNRGAVQAVELAGLLIKDLAR